MVQSQVFPDSGTLGLLLEFSCMSFGLSNQGHEPAKVCLWAQE